jgi:hypothetical protein
MVLDHNSEVIAEISEVSERDILADLVAGLSHSHAPRNRLSYHVLPHLRVTCFKSIAELLTRFKLLSTP